MSIEAHTNKLAWDGPYDPSDPDPLGKVEESQGENPGVAPNSSAYNTNPDLQDVRNFHQASSLAGLGAAMSPLLATGGLLSSLPFYSRIPLQALSLGSSTSGSVLPAANSISQVSRSIGNAAEAAKDNIEKADPRLVPLLQTGSLGAMALAGIGAGTHGLANSPETQARLGYKAIAPLLPTPVRLAKHFSRYSPQMTGSYNVAVEAPFLLRKVRSMVNDGTMSEEEASKILKDFVNNTSIEMEQAGNRSLTEDSKRFSKSMNQAVQGVNSITNDEALGTQSAHYLARQAAKGVVPWPYKALTYIPTEKFMPAVRDIYGHITGSKKVEPKPYLEGSYDPLHEAVLEATKGKGAENFYSREVAPLFEEYEKAPYSDKPRILNSIVNSVGSKMGLPAQEIQADIADKGVDAVASKLKNTLQNKSRLNQYVPGYEEAGSAAIAANTAQSAANTGRIMASVAEAPLKGLRYTQQYNS
jgi:polyhydroxyalkanoate synthesis regulator phasin